MSRLLVTVLLLTLGITSLAHSEAFQWEIIFKGNEDYSHDQLLEQLGIPEEFPAMDASRRDLIIRIARGNLESFYLATGYFNSHIGLEWTVRSDKVWEYVFHIEEGTRFKFRNSAVQLPPESPVLVESTSLMVAQKSYFEFDQVSLDVQTLRNAYLKKGYLHVRVDHMENVDRKEHAVDVQFTVKPGHQVLMGSLSAQVSRSGWNGTQGMTDTNWLKGLWELDSGTAIDGSYLTSFRSKLLSTQIFSRILIEDTLRTDGSGLSDLTIRAVERIPGEARIGAFFEESDGFGFSIDVKHRNLGGNFQEGSGKLMIAQNRQEMILGYANPIVLGTSIRWIPTAIRLDDQLIFSHENLPLPENPDSLEERYELANRGEISFGLSDHLRSRTSGEIRYVDRPSNRGLRLKLETSLPIDFTDNPYEPIKGFRSVPSVGVGRSLRGGLTNLQVSSPYPYVQIRNAAYYPIFGPFLAAIAYDYGHFFAEAADDDARTFFQGGSRSLRGYRFRSVFASREVPATAPDTGTVLEPGLSPTYQRASAELRVNIPVKSLKDFQLVQFVDWTRVSDANSDYATAEEMAVGTGLRYRWKVLTLRLDYTWKKSFSQWGLEPFETSRITFDLSQAI